MLVACIGHWYTSLLYAVPVVGVGAGLKLSSIRARREDEAEERAAELELAAGRG